MFIKPSRSIVYLTCSDPGVTEYSAFAIKPFSSACFAIEAALEISSYDEFVQLPINPTETSRGQPFSFATSPIFEIGVARSGVNGPLICGSNSDKFISIT